MEPPKQKRSVISSIGNKIKTSALSDLEGGHLPSFKTLTHMWTRILYAIWLIIIMGFVASIFSIEIVIMSVLFQYILLASVLFTFVLLTIAIVVIVFKSH